MAFRSGSKVFALTVVGLLIFVMVPMATRCSPPHATTGPRVTLEGPVIAPYLAIERAIYSEGVSDAQVLGLIDALRLAKVQELGDEFIPEAFLDSEIGPFFGAAIYNGRIGLMRALIDRGLDPTTMTTLSRGEGAPREPPLHIAVRSGSPAVIEFLVDAGLPVDGAGGDSQPLKLAIERDDDTLVRTLLELGADPDGPDADGKPLHFATLNASVEMVELLLRNNASYAAAFGAPPRAQRELDDLLRRGALSDPDLSTRDERERAVRDLLAQTADTQPLDEAAQSESQGDG